MRLDMEQGSLDAGILLEHVHGGVRLKGRTDGRTWRSQGELALDSAIWRGVQLTAVQGPLVMDQEGVRFGLTAGGEEGRSRRLSARVAGGSVYADGSVSAGPGGTFAVAAAVSDAQIERLAGDMSALSGAAQKYTGKVFGAIEVSGARTGTHSLVEIGRAHV